MPQPSAQVSVTIKHFHKIGGGKTYSSADVLLTDGGNGAVSQAGLNQPLLVNSPCSLVFSVDAAPGDDASYIPVGIALRGSPADPRGALAFPDRSVASAGTTVKLVLVDTNPARDSYDFDLVVQRSDGDLGVIDPLINNT